MLRKALCALLVILFALITSAWVFLNSDYVKHQIALTIEERVSKELGMEVSIGSLSFTLPNMVTAKKLSITQKESTWLIVDSITLIFSVSDLWQGNISVDTLTIKNPHLLNIPISEHTAENTAKNDAISLSIPHIAINNFTVDKKLLQQYAIPSDLIPASLTLHGGLLPDGSLQLSCNKASAPLLSICGELHLSSSLDATGTVLALELFDLSFLNSLVEISSTGPISFQGSLSGHLQHPQAIISVNSPQLTWKSLLLKDIHGTIVSSNDPCKGTLSFSANCNNNLVSGETEYAWDNIFTLNNLAVDAFDSQIRGNLEIDLNSRIVSGKLTGHIQDIASLTTQASGQVLAALHLTQAIELDLISPKLILNENTLENARVSLTATDLMINPHIDASIMIDKGASKLFNMENISSMISLDYREGAIHGVCTINNLSFSQNSSLDSTPLKGNLKAHSTITGPLSSPSADITFLLDSLILDDKAFASLPPASSTLNLVLNENGATCTGVMQAYGVPTVDFEAAVPTKCSLYPLELTIDPQAPISGYLKASGDITSLLQLFSVDTSMLAGSASGSLELSGSMNAPQFKGICDIQNGKFELAEIGVLLHNVTAHIEAKDKQILLQQLSANDAKGNSLTGSGQMNIDMGQHCPFTLDLQLDKIIAFQQDYIQMTGSGPLKLQGDLQSGTLTGNIEINEGSFTIPDQAPSLMNNVEVTYVNVPNDQPMPQIFHKTPSPWPLNFDIAIHIPKTLAIEGGDLTSVWGGDIYVKGNTSTPQLQGEIKVDRGQYLFNGKPFALKQGTIIFAGDVEKKTSLYVIASKDLTKAKVDVIVKGPVKKPVISFRSNPPMPQKEILSWLLFDRGTSEISPFQGSQLSESISNLDSSNQGPDILTKIRSALGVDRLEIQRNDDLENGGVSVQVGKYISDNIFISVNKSDVNRLAIEAALTERIKLQAEVGDDAQGQLLLKWKRDY